MKSFYKKTAAALLSIAVVVAATGCSNKEEEAVNEVATAFVEEVLTLNLEDAIEYVSEDEQDAFVLSVDEDCQAVIVAALDGSEFEINETEIDEDEACVTFDITHVIVSDVVEELGEGYSVEELVAAVEDAELFEDRIEVELEKDDDEWFVTNGDVIIKYFERFVDDVEFGGVSEAGAVEVLDTAIAAFAANDKASLANCFSDGADVSNDVVYVPYFANLEYEVLSSNVDEDSVSLEISYSAPSFQAALDAAFADPEALCRNGFADALYVSMSGEGDEEAAAAEMLDYILSFLDINVTDTNTATIDFVLVDDALVIDGSADTFLNVEPEMDLTDEQEMELFVLSAGIWAEEGLITEEEANALMMLLGLSDSITAGATGGGEAEFFATSYSNQSDDFYDCTIYDANGGFYPVAGDPYMDVRMMTWAYYDMVDNFSYDVQLNGEEYVPNTIVNTETDSDDTFYLHIEGVDGALPAGQYVVNFYNPQNEIIVTVSFEL